MVEAIVMVLLAVGLVSSVVEIDKLQGELRVARSARWPALLVSNAENNCAGCGADPLAYAKSVCPGCEFGATEAAVQAANIKKMLRGLGCPVACDAAKGTLTFKNKWGGK